MSWATRIGTLLGSPVASGSKLGGDLGGATLIALEDGRKLVAKQGPLVEREGAMLEAIAHTGTPVPKVFHCEDDLLLMEQIHAGGETSWPDLARALNRLHSPQDAAYGWEADYAFGPVAIPNAACENWPEFWAERRLLCHSEALDGSVTRRLEKLAARLPEMLPEAPPVSLLHGDLWGGNILYDGNGLAALIDPACYYGDREVDAAMLTLFDRPPDSFFDALDLALGWRERQPIYRLWPLLVHLRLFGWSYRDSVMRALDELKI